MSEIKSDERVIFFPTLAARSADGQSWSVPIHGWIFEPEEDDRLRRVTVRTLCQTFDLPPGELSTELFERRIRLFLVDNERWKRIAIRLVDQERKLPRSHADGHFTETLQLPAALVDPAIERGRLRYSAVTRPNDPRRFHGISFCLPRRGLSVVSDIDDTIKVTQVRDKRQVMRNTFLREFQAVEGMSAVYRRWALAGLSFHFVSASPWQLYEPLSKFIHEAGFPEASFHLKRFRLKDSSLVRLFEDPIRYKLAEIEPLLQTFPERCFVLVGDSGEKDPEVYGVLARRYPNQIRRIFIRDVTGEAADAPRYREAMDGLPHDLCQLFRQPSELHGWDPSDEPSGR
jgi:hypothetical protein